MAAICPSDRPKQETFVGVRVITGSSTVIDCALWAVQPATVTVYVTVCVPLKGSNTLPETLVPDHVPPIVPVIWLFRFAGGSDAQSVKAFHDGSGVTPTLIDCTDVSMHAPFPTE